MQIEFESMTIQINKLYKNLIYLCFGKVKQRLTWESVWKWKSEPFYWLRERGTEEDRNWKVCSLKKTTLVKLLEGKDSISLWVVKTELWRMEEEVMWSRGAPKGWSDGQTCGGSTMIWGSAVGPGSAALWGQRIKSSFLFLLDGRTDSESVSGRRTHASARVQTGTPLGMSGMS